MTSGYECEHRRLADEFLGNAAEYSFGEPAAARADGDQIDVVHLGAVHPASRTRTSSTAVEVENCCKCERPEPIAEEPDHRAGRVQGFRRAVIPTSTTTGPAAVMPGPSRISVARPSCRRVTTSEDE